LSTRVNSVLLEESLTPKHWRALSVEVGNTKNKIPSILCLANFVLLEKSSIRFRLFVPIASMGSTRIKTRWHLPHAKFVMLEDMHRIQLFLVKHVKLVHFKNWRKLPRTNAQFVPVGNTRIQRAQLVVVNAQLEKH
jgi:hypothetical protein